ncbi:hypothetical protein M569_16648, partial [Genlisea aurea]
MAVQVGMGFSRIILIAGAGCTGTILLKNGKLSDVIGELQKLVKGWEPDKDSDSNNDHSEAIAAQASFFPLHVRRLAQEVRQLASSKQITILNTGSGQSNAVALVIPAAALLTVGYGYMWWKGLKLSDLMYVTKRSMANAVSNLTKHLENVSEAVAAAKKHLTQRIENLDGKLDEQVEISKLIRNEVVNDVRGDLSQIGFDLDELHRMVAGLDGKLLSLEGKQELANAGVMYLCSVMNGKKVKMPELLQDQFKIGGNSVPALMGLKDIADSFNSGFLLTDGN